MQGRRGWALLLLAAVFTMHGLQCAAADSSAASSAHGTGVHAASGAAPAPHQVDSSAATASHEGMSAPTLTAAAVAGSPLGAGHDSSPHGAGHLWAVCLAVLAAGLAAMLVALVGRLPELRLPLLRPVTERPWGWLSPPRPPDLHSLCLLRI